MCSPITETLSESVFNNVKDQNVTPQRVNPLQIKRQSAMAGQLIDLKYSTCSELSYLPQLLHIIQTAWLTMRSDFLSTCTCARAGDLTTIVDDIYTRSDGGVLFRRIGNLFKQSPSSSLVPSGGIDVRPEIWRLLQHSCSAEQLDILHLQASPRQIGSFRTESLRITNGCDSPPFETGCTGEYFLTC